jgi:hypothetical protein
VPVGDFIKLNSKSQTWQKNVFLKTRSSSQIFALSYFTTFVQTQTGLASPFKKIKLYQNGIEIVIKFGETQ